MPTISTCPRCSQMVTIPERLDRAALVRCPLCGAQYPLNEALELVPPELIPVTVAEIAQPTGASEQSASNLPPSRGPVFPVEFSALALDTDTSEHDFTAADTASATESHLDAEALAAITNRQDKPPGEFSGQAESSLQRRRIQRKPKNAVRIFIEIVLGGLVGLSIAYVALAWILGSRFELPRPPQVLRPVLRFVLPERIWEENQQPHKSP